MSTLGHRSPSLVYYPLLLQVFDSFKTTHCHLARVIPNMLHIKSFRVLVTLLLAYLFFIRDGSHGCMTTAFCRYWVKLFGRRNDVLWLIATEILARCMIELKLNNYCWRTNVCYTGTDRSVDLMWFESFLKWRDWMLFVAIWERNYINSSWTNFPLFWSFCEDCIKKSKCIWSVLEISIITAEFALRYALTAVVSFAVFCWLAITAFSFS